MAGVAAVRAEGETADDDRYADGLDGGNRRVSQGQAGGEGGGQADGVRSGAVNVADQVRGGDLGAEVCDLPAAQPERLGEQACGQRVPLLVHAGDGHSPADGVAADSREGCDDAVVDGGGGVLVRDTHAVGGPLDAHLVLDGADHLEQDRFRLKLGLQGVGDDVERRGFVGGPDR